MWIYIFLKLLSLPDDIGNGLESCEEINVSNNVIVHVPVSIAKMPRLKNLKLNNNSIVDFPNEILSNSTVCFIEIENNVLPEDKFRELDGYEKVIYNIYIIKLINRFIYKRNIFLYYN